MSISKIKIYFSLIAIIFCINISQTNAVEYVYSDAIKTKVIDKNLNHLEIIVNWKELPLVARKTFEFYKISHSRNNPSIKYPENYIWYSNDINIKSAFDNFNDYNPDYKWINYFRTCIIADKYYCEKKASIIELKEASEKSKILEISSTKTDNERTTNINYSAQWSAAQIEVSDVVWWTLIKNFFTFILYIIIFIILYKLSKIIITNRFKKQENIYINQNENTLQILKNDDNYIIEFNWIYNKWIKVLEKNKQNISSSIYNYVNSISKLQVRWKDIFEELQKMEIKIPDLKESWNTIYRLYIPENIRENIEKLQTNESLIIKTDEQEIPWEIMHDNNNFLSLKHPISRKIMTRENIRKNKITKNKKVKILFITNPTNDLEWTETEIHHINKQIWNKANITIISWEQANSAKILSLLWQDYWDVIHYSWHAFFDNNNPDNSWIVLSDSIITAHEIKRVINWNPLIFLNACSSWRNEEKDFDKTWEDTVWIASAFIIWWAKWVISTLWPVNDNIASDFAIEFYNNFLKNETIWNSILKAKKETYVKYPRDITWASFIYYWDLNLKI